MRLLTSISELYFLFCLMGSIKQPAKAAEKAAQAEERARKKSEREAAKKRQD